MHVNVEIAVVPAAGPEETVEPLDLVHQFLGSSGGGKRLEVADRPVHAVAALEDDLPDRAVVHPLGQFLHRPAMPGHQPDAHLEVLLGRRLTQRQHTLATWGHQPSPASP